MSSQRTKVEQEKLNKELWRAALDGNINLVTRAIESGADVNYKQFESAPLHLAASKGHHSVVELLLSAGADHSVLDGDQNTILHSACFQSNPAIVELLLNKYSNLVNSTNKFGRTPLHIAFSRKYDSVIKLLCKRADPSVTDSNGDTILHIACLHNNPAIVEQLLNKCSNLINHTNKDGNTVLHIACLQSNPAIVEQLLNKCSNLIDHTDKDGNTVLHIACLQNNLAIVELLTNKSPNLINSTNKFGRTPLHIALSRKCESIVEVLCIWADLSVTDNDGDTVLHLACSPAIVQLILNKSPNLIKSTNKYGDTVLHSACSQTNPAVVELLLNKSPNLIKSTNKDGDTVLHRACLQSNPAVVELLLNKSPTLINCANKIGKSPLHIAAYEGNHSIVQLLLSKGGNPTVYDNGGNTAVDDVLRQLANTFIPKFRDQYIPTLAVFVDAFPQLIEHVTESGMQVKDILSRDVISKANTKILFLQAMKEGSVSIRIVQLLIVGAPAVGKSSFLRFLFNQPALMKHTSTGITTRPTQAIDRLAGRDGTNIWEIVTDEMLCCMIAQAFCLLQNASEKPVTSSSVVDVADSTSIEGIEESVLSSSATVYTSDHVAIRKDSNVSDIHSIQHSTLPSEAVSDSSFELEIAPDPSFIPDQLISHAIAGTVSDDLIRSTWIHITDSGGQPQFSDISRAFIRGNSVNVIAFKLTESLNQKPKFLYSIDGKVLNQPSDLQMTNLELIQHFIRSIVSSKYHLRSGFESIEFKPYIVVLGTYYDHAWMWQWIPGVQNLQQKNAILLEALKEFEDHLIFFNEAANELIFPVDNTCFINRKKISSDIRSRIMQRDLGFRVDIPIRWYIFELKIKEMVAKSTHGIVTIDSCNEVGVKLGMGPSDVERCIDYLASLTLFLHVPAVHHVIFTNPQYILDMISEVVSVSFIKYSGTPLPPGTVSLLRHKGQFNESLLDVLQLPFYPPCFTKEHFLTLLIYTCVIAHIEGGDYFIPIVLPTHQLTYEQKDQYRQCCEPLVMKFKCNIVPQGVFPTLVVSLLNRQKPPLFKLDIRCTQLRYSFGLCFDGGSLLLVDSFTWMEVYYTGILERCTVIRKVLDEAISICAELLSYEPESIQYIPAVLCRQKHSKKVKVHTVDIKNEFNRFNGYCTIDHTMPPWKVENGKELCWFSDIASDAEDQPVITNAHVTASRLIEPNGIQLSVVDTDQHIPVVTDITTQLNNAGSLDITDLDDVIASLQCNQFADHRWKELGLQLGLYMPTLEDIDDKCRGNPRKCLQECLAAWLRKEDKVTSKGGPTWTSLATALDKINRH